MLKVVAGRGKCQPGPADINSPGHPFEHCTGSLLPGVAQPLTQPQQRCMGTLGPRLFLHLPGEDRREALRC